MQIAFYAPMKPPHHPVPSGDRRMARLLIRALTLAGHTVTVASSLRSWDGKGEAARQHELEARAVLEIDDLCRHYAAAGPPDIWFTYHLYHKAPDLIGPVVRSRLGIPYVVAEASHAPKRRTGPWAAWHAKAAAAISTADAVFHLNPSDAECIDPILGEGAKAVRLPPFTDTATYAGARARRDETRRHLSEKWGLRPEKPWFVTAAMMREDVKKDSYALLAESLNLIGNDEWEFLIVGDGPARATVETMFGFAPRTAFLGALGAGDLAAIQAACDLALWPSLNEAFGLSLLEAQAAGLPVVSGRNAGVANMIRHGETGLLVEMGDAAAFADAVRSYLADPEMRRAHGAAAQANTAQRHSLESAADILAQVLGAIAGRGAG